jgi:hypothetical protein
LYTIIKFRQYISWFTENQPDMFGGNNPPTGTGSFTSTTKPSGNESKGGRYMYICGVETFILTFCSFVNQANETSCLAQNISETPSVL